jgi:chloramphenicol-sensitive protein RarD
MSKVPLERKSTTPYFLSAFLAAALWGFMSIPLRAIRAWPSEDILYYRIGVSVLLIWLFIGLFRKAKLREDWTTVKAMTSAQRKKLGGSLLVACLLIMGNWLSFIYAVNHISIQSSSLAYLICPLLTTLAGFFLLKEILTPVKKVALGVALIGVAVLGSGSLVEVAWALTIASFYALYLVLQRIMQQVDKLNLLAAQLTICTLLVLPFMLYQGHEMPTEPVFWTNIVLIAVFFTIIPLYMSMWALNGISSSTVGILIYINPIITFTVAVLYFGETVHTAQIVGYLILLVAVIVFNSAVLRSLLGKKALS